MEIPGTLNEGDIYQRILVVDDDAAITQLVARKFESSGFEVFTALSGEEALSVLEQQGLPHLAIVDINMPGMNGFELCRQLQSFSDLPIIFLTAVDQEEIVIQGIEHFAEDYVIKPFSPRELVARVRRVLRRMGDYNYTLTLITEIDERLSVDFVHKIAYIDGAEVALTPTETKILYILMRNGGHTVSNDFLLRRLWPLDEVFEDTLRVHIHRLRHKIEATPSRPRYITTVRGIGYSFMSR
ncbi:MAG: response regulator transcription factor [Caldilineaceae bacterium]|nr:response regulator transcription factor [Caldilineaceae bacterium]